MRGEPGNLIMVRARTESMTGKRSRPTRFGGWSSPSGKVMRRMTVMRTIAIL